MLFQTSNTENMDCPISTRLEARSVPMVKGCPGIPRSVPRIETVLNIRSINDSPFVIRTVKIQLMTRQTVLVPTKFGSNEATKELVIYEDPMAFQPPMGKFSQRLHGLDIPILIPIPRDITPSGHSPTFGATTSHYLVVSVSLGKDSASELTFVDSFPVDIKMYTVFTFFSYQMDKMYDTLPIYRQYNEPIVETNNSSDNQVLVEATVPYTSVGPKDDLSVSCLLKTNAANNKVKKHITLKQLTFQVKEVIECYDAGLPPKREFKLHTESKYYTKELNSQGITQSFQIQFPYENDYLEMFSPPPEIDTEAEVTEDFATTIIESTNISKLKTIDKLPEGVPVTNIQGFTLSGKFYSIWFEIVIKVKLSHAKDMNIHIPIIVSPFDKEASKHLLDWIMLECEIAKAQFGKEFNRTYSSTTKYSSMIKLLDKYRQPPSIYDQHKNKISPSNSRQYLDLYID